MHKCLNPLRNNSQLKLIGWSFGSNESLNPLRNNSQLKLRFTN